jgi:hypothetical protein
MVFAVLAALLVVAWRYWGSQDAPASKSNEARARAPEKPVQPQPTANPVAGVQSFPFPASSVNPAKPAKPETLEQAVAAYRLSNPGPLPAPPAPRLGPDGQPLTFKEALDAAQQAARAREAASAAASPFAQR